MRMFRKDLNRKYDLNIIYNDTVYQKLLSKVTLEELDKRYFYDQTFETEYDLLKHLINEYDVKLSNDSLDGFSVEFNYQVDNGRGSISPLYENDYFDHKNITEMAGYLSIILPHIYKALIKVYRDDSKYNKQIKDVEDAIRRFNEGIITRKKNLEILSNKKVIIEDSIKNLEDNNILQKDIELENEKQNKLSELERKLQSVNYMYKDTAYDLEVCTKSKSGRMQGLFNILYKNATYEELRYAYSIMKPFRAYYNQLPQKQELGQRKNNK